MNLDQTNIEKALTTLGAVLASRGFTYELVVVGGSALMMLGVISRPTKDIDVVALVQAAAWAESHDPSPAFHSLAKQALAAFGIGEDNDRA
jgi:hypothetical protein